MILLYILDPFFFKKSISFKFTQDTVVFPNEHNAAILFDWRFFGIIHVMFPLYIIDNSSPHTHLQYSSSLKEKKETRLRWRKG
mmetsp:Transcript_31243/g.47833  ORF Transcript_31243/g.47833 Transcript_31243/m.47833 type:complete len:83 (-) Transcript_31243:44-292(-)